MDKATPRPWKLGHEIKWDHINKNHTRIETVAKPSDSRFSHPAVICYLKMCDEHWSPIDGLRVEQDMKANAELIVRAVNCHDELVEALHDEILSLATAREHHGLSPYGTERLNKLINLRDRAKGKA
jgi:hypothetical protein